MESGVNASNAHLFPQVKGSNDLQLEGLQNVGSGNVRIGEFIHHEKVTSG